MSTPAMITPPTPSPSTRLRSQMAATSGSRTAHRIARTESPGQPTDRVGSPGSGALGRTSLEDEAKLALRPVRPATACRKEPSALAQHHAAIDKECCAG